MAVEILDLDTTKTYLGIGTTDTARDNLITELLAEVEARFEEYTDRALESREFTMHFDGGGKFISLPHWPVDTDQDVTVVDTHVSPEETLDPTEDFQVDAEAGLLTRPIRPGRNPIIWRAGERRWKVTWTGGLSAAADWANIQLALRSSFRQYVADHWHNRNPRATSEQIGGGVGTKLAVGDIPPNVAEAWNDWRRLM